jgi:uncharacterized protein YceK
VIAVAVAAAALWGCTSPTATTSSTTTWNSTTSPTTVSTPATTTTAASVDEPTDLPATALIDTLHVAAPDPTIPDYVRDRFGDDWDYDPATGCSTRERVLAAEAVELLDVDDRCRPRGRWISPYDGVATTDPADLEIDHFVPLADAWRSGAHRWSDERRRAFANHEADPEELVAVTSRTNRSKSDSSPDEWLPPDRGTWCDYASDWVQVKARWDLTVTPAEKSTLVAILSGC